MKACNTCGQEKDESEFYLLKRRSKTYLRGECKDCSKAQLKAIDKTESGKQASRAASKRYMAERKLLADAALAAIAAGIIADPRLKASP